MLESKNSVAHVLPSMNFGGVEVAISKSFRTLNQDFDYKVYYVKEHGTINVNQLPVFELFKNILKGSNYPDILLTSLWWGHLVGIFLYPFRIKWVCFIHSTGYSSIFDKFVTKLALILCDNHIFDSESSRVHFDSFQNHNNFVVPYIFTNYDELKNFNHNPQFTFSWVGRNSKEKRLDLLVKFITSMIDRDVSFLINICIAGESYSPLDNLAIKYKESIVIQYNIPPQHVNLIHKNSKISLCFSDYEGFSASTAEAALQGNLICARKIGELPNYLCNKNTIWLDDLSNYAWRNFILRVEDCIKDEVKFLERRAKSQKYTNNLLGKRSYISSLSTILKKLCDA